MGPGSISSVDFETKLEMSQLRLLASPMFRHLQSRAAAKYIALAMAAAIAIDAQAAPPLNLTGRNSLGEEITVIGESEGAFHSEVEIRKSGVVTILRKQGCDYEPSGDVFFCPSRPESPLSGTRYRFKRNRSSDECGRIAACEQGCGQRAPVELLESGYECYDGGQCRNFKTINGEVRLISMAGKVAGSRVNLRENPHSQSRSLRTVVRGTRVSLVGASMHCTAIDGVEGMWAEVQVEDGAEPRRGWMFDGYIDYDNGSALPGVN